MCTIKFTPPVPPPLPHFVFDETVIQLRKEKCLPDKSKTLIEEIREVCCKLRELLEKLSVPTDTWLSFCQDVTSVLQVGPMCGLVALSMASELCMNDHSVIPALDLLNMARKLKFSNKGEIFSAKDMVMLSRCVLENVQVLHVRFSDKLLILTHLAQGNPILVPYDADFNHEPCLKKGHKAHWAVLLGAVLLTPKIPNTSHSDSEISWLHYVTYGTELLHIIDDIATEKVYVYAKQGKSNHLALWSYQKLIESNDNLYEVDPARADENNQYLIPKEGLQNELLGQAIILSKHH